MRLANVPRHRSPLSRVELDAILHALDPDELRSPLVRRIAARGFTTEDVLGRLAWRLERLGRPAPSTLVHVGCGSTGIGLWLAEATGAQLLAIDPDAYALEQAMRACGSYTLEQFPSFFCTPLDHLPLPTACAQVVVSTDALYRARDPIGALGEVKRVLEVDGVLLFEVYVSDEDATASGWVHTLEYIGFDVVDIDDQTRHWRSVLRAQHLARIEYGSYLVERLGERRAASEIAASRCMLSEITTTRRIELVARRRRTHRLARGSQSGHFLRRPHDRSGPLR